MSGSQNADAFRTVLWDDFSNGYNWANWGKPYDGGVYWNGAWSWNAGDVNVRGGEMQVTMTHHDNGWWTGGGFNSMKAGISIHYGTVSFDAKVDEGQGTMAAILLWPAADDHWPPEVDILETPGQDAMHTLHWQGPGGGDWYDAVRTSSYDPSQWHHYDVTWLPDRMTIQVDGRTVAEWTDHIPDEAMGFGVMSFVGTWHEEWMGGAPDASTPDAVTVHLDNVVMAQWTGADPGTPTPAQRAPAWQEAGWGSDSLVLSVSQDAYKGDAQYTVSVDGQQVGGTFTASALRSSGQYDTLTLHGNWGAGAHTVTVDFLNDRWDGTPETDRNLYVSHAEYNGAWSGALGDGWYGGSFAVQGAAPAPAPFPAPSQGASTDWGAISAQVLANYQATGHWYL